MEKLLVLMRILAKSWVNVAKFCPKPKLQILWTYQDMMEWMIRILDGDLAEFCPKLKTKTYELV
jgi:hypothetical protein